MRGTAVSYNKRQIGQESSNAFGGFDVEQYLDFRGIGKSTRCNVDHSKFHCILPYTSLKETNMKLNYIRYLQDQA